MKKAIVYIPKNYNNGQKIDPNIIDNFIIQLVNIAGGLTDKGEVKGFYKNRQDEIIEDINKNIEIGCTTEQLEEIKQVLLELKDQLNQESIYLEYDNEITFL